MERKGSAPGMSTGTQSEHLVSTVSIVLLVHCLAHENLTFHTGSRAFRRIIIFGKTSCLCPTGKVEA